MTGEACRIDLWLWRARFFKTRALAVKAVEAGAIRRNDVRLDKPSRTVHVGDTLVFATSGRLVALEILGLGERRGPAVEARTLYTELKIS